MTKKFSASGAGTIARAVRLHATVRRSELLVLAHRVRLLYASAVRVVSGDVEPRPGEIERLPRTIELPGRVRREA